MFGAVKVTKNVEPDKCSFSEYAVGFDSLSLFSISNFNWSKKAIIFGADMSSSVNIDNENNDILILAKGPTQGLNNTILRAKA